LNGASQVKLISITAAGQQKIKKSFMLTLLFARYKKMKAPIKIGARMNSNRPSENIFIAVK